MSFAAAAEEVRLFDIRAYREMMAYNYQSKTNAVSFSASGRLLFAGYENCCVAWDTLKGESVYSLEHSSAVLCLGVSPNGKTLFTGSDDAVGRVGAFFFGVVNELDLGTELKIFVCFLCK
jgi:WD40 repeat protein